MGESVVPTEDEARAGARRTRVVAAIANAIEHAAAERARRHRRLQFAAGFASAAVLLAALGLAWRARAPTQADRTDPNAAKSPVAAPVVSTTVAHVHTLAGSVHATHDGRVAAPAPSGEIALGAGDEVTTELDARSEVTLEDGVTLSLDGASHLRLPPSPDGAAAPAREQVRFDVGIVHVRVPRMPAGHTFSVKTPDAEVTVHGTSFTVEVAPAGTTASTRVVVAEGVVSVSSAGQEALLTAGMEWPAKPAGAGLSAAASAPPAATSAPLGRGPSAPRPRPTPPEVGVASSLAEQNRLLEGAMDASRAGEDLRAIETLNDLLTRFPSSPLAQEACVQRFRALDRTGNRRDAAREARLYLAAYPNGFARDEAKKLAFEH